VGGEKILKSERISLTELHVIIPETRFSLWIFFSLIKFVVISFIRKKNNVSIISVSLDAFYNSGFFSFSVLF